MAEPSTLARPYAKAAFDHAQASNALSQWETLLSIASQTVRDASFTEFLGNPAVRASQKTQLLAELIREQLPASEADTFDSSVQNFFEQLAQNNRLTLLPQISEQYRLHRAKSNKQIEAHITTALPMDETQRTLIRNRLEQSLNASVVLQESVDASLIAGATIKIGDKVVDDSVKGKLKQLKTQLASA